MRATSIAGIGQTKIGERWDRSLLALAVKAVLAAMQDAPDLRPQAIVVGNMMSGELNGQQSFATLLSDAVGLAGIESFRVEAACASSASAVRVGTALIASGQYEQVLVVGAEKMTDTLPGETTAALAAAADADTEAVHGATFAALNALLMRLYLERHHLPEDALAPFPISAHEHACHNPHAMFHRRISHEDYLEADFVATPLRVLDAAPVCDGAAAVLLTERSLAVRRSQKPVHILASAAASDRFTLAARPNPLQLVSAQKSAAAALDLAGLRAEDMDVLELHDAFSILSALSIESLGLTTPGRAHEWMASAEVSSRFSSLGGLKARGHPVGASGLYQMVDACTQLRGEAGAAQVDGARLALTQNFGGLATTAVTHILGRDD